MKFKKIPIYKLKDLKAKDIKINKYHLQLQKRTQKIPPEDLHTS